MKHYTLPLVTAIALVYGGIPAHSAERLGRLTVDIKIDGKGRQQKDSTYSTFTTDETLHIAFTLVSSGVPEDTNRLDTVGNAVALQKQADQAKARAPDRVGQEAAMERARAAMAACNGNVTCMTQVAQKMGQQTASWNVLPPDYSANAGRFLTYATPDAAICKGEVSAQVKTDVEGKLADVQGLVPFTKLVRADYRASGNQTLSLCNGIIVVDTRENRIFAYIPEMEVKGHKVWTEGARTTLDSHDGEIRLNQDALVWAAKQLQNAPRSGTQRTLLKMPTDTALGGVGEKNIDVQVAWKFDSR